MRGASGERARALAGAHIKLLSRISVRAAGLRLWLNKQGVSPSGTPIPIMELVKTDELKSMIRNETIYLI
jgi:hypothetical protein